MEKGKGVMGSNGRRWAVDFIDNSTSPSSRDVPDPPGFSRASLDQVTLSLFFPFYFYFYFFFQFRVYIIFFFKSKCFLKEEFKCFRTNPPSVAKRRMLNPTGKPRFY